MKKLPIKKIIITAWIVFSVLYIGYNQYTYLVGFIAKNSYDKGISDAVSSVISQAQKCEVFPIYIGGNKVNLINAACVKQSQSDAVKSK